MRTHLNPVLAQRPASTEPGWGASRGKPALPLGAGAGLRAQALGSAASATPVVSPQGSWSSVSSMNSSKLNAEQVSSGVDGAQAVSAAVIRPQSERLSQAEPRLLSLNGSDRFVLTCCKQTVPSSAQPRNSSTEQQPGGESGICSGCVLQNGPKTLKIRVRSQRAVCREAAAWPPPCIRVPTLQVAYFNHSNDDKKISIIG